MKDHYKDDLGVQIARASRLGDIAFLRKVFLVEKKADILRVTKDAWWNYLHRALNVPSITQPPPETVQFYVDHGVDVNAQDGSGTTPLHYAVEGNNTAAVKILLEAGADPNIADREGVTPFDNAFGRINLDIIEILLKNGANPNRVKNNLTRLGAINFVLENAILTEEERSRIEQAKKIVIKYGGHE